MSAYQRKENSYQIVDENGKVIEKFRLKGTALGALGRLKELHGQNLKVVTNV